MNDEMRYLYSSITSTDVFSYSSKTSSNGEYYRKIFNIRIMKLFIVVFLIYNCKCFFPFSCMTTARVPPKGSFSAGVYHERIMLGKNPGFLPVVFGRYSISDIKELGFAVTAINMAPDYLPVLLFDYKHLAAHETRWSPSVSVSVTTGVLFILPWVGARFTFSKKIFFIEPYLCLEYGMLAYGAGCFGVKIPNNEKFATYCELNAWEPFMFVETFPEGRLGHGTSLAVGLEYKF